jgi:hypothetical protein
MDICLFNPDSGEWNLVNYYCLYHSIDGNWTIGTWYVNSTKKHAMKIFSDDESGGFDSSNQRINVTSPNQSTLTRSYFNPDNLELSGTRLQADAYGFNDIGLDFNDSIVSILFDESGSMSWNDENGFRHDLAKRFISKVSGSYPAEVLYKIFTFGGQKIKLSVTANLESDNQFNTLNSEFYQQYLFNDSLNNFAGIRVVRREDAFPSNPIDGEILFDGVSNGIQDLGVEANKTYYYGIYTFNTDYQFSDGVRIQLTPNDESLPRGVKTFSSEVLIGSGVIVDNTVWGVWHFDEADGQILYDFTSSADLSVSESNAIWLNADDVPFGKSGLRFNGETTAVTTQSVISTFDLREDESITISSWIKPYSFTSNKAIVMRQDGTTANYALYTNADGGLTFDTDFASVSSAVDVLSENQWNKIDVSIDMSDGSISFFVNGSPVGSSILGSINLSIGDMYFDIGYNRGAIANVDSFFGEICEVILYNTVKDFDYILDQHNTLRNDNGDRLIVLKFTIPEIYGFNGDIVSIVSNDIRIPSYEGDGQEIYSNAITSDGDFYTTFQDGFVLDENQYFRIFSQNISGNICHIDDAMSITVLVPDIDIESRELVSPLSFSLSSPYTFEGTAGDRKVYLKWNLDASDERIKRIKIYRSTTAFPVFDEYGNSDGTLVFDDDIFKTKYIDRLLSNDTRYYYIISTVDKFGRPSNSSTVSIIPLSGLDESQIPLEDVENIRYEIVSGSNLKILWDDFVPKRDISTFFDEDISFFMKMTDQSDNPISRDYTISWEVENASYTYPDDVAEDIFAGDSTVNAPDVNELYGLTVTKLDNGLSRGLLKLTNDVSLLSNLESVLLSIRFTVSFEGLEFVYKSRLIQIEWKNKLSFEVENKDSKYVEVVSKHTINALDKQIPSSATDYDGTYATSSSSYISRIYLKDEDLAATFSNTAVSAAVYDATVDFDADKVQPETGLLSVFSYINSAIEVISGTREKRDIYGNLTGETENVTYADISLATPTQAQTVLLYVKVHLRNGSTIIKKKLVVFGNPLVVDIQPNVPLSDGRQVLEQTAIVYMLDPDDPKDLSKRTFLPDTATAEWSLTKKDNAIDRIFYSEDDTGDPNGIFSFLNKSVARNVFLGPINNVRIYDSEVEYETHTMDVSVFYDGLTASDSQVIELIPLRERGHRVMPSNFLMEFADLKQKFWSDGIGYATLTISHDAVVSTTKYSEPFRQCMSSVGNDIHQLNHGMMVRIDTSDPEVEIIWGDVVEYLDPYLDRWVLNTDNATIDHGAASVNLSRYDNTFVYFRLNRKNSDAEITGFESLRTDCAPLISDKYSLYNNEITVTGHIVSVFDNETLTLTGGGSFETGLVPTVLVPEESLRMRVVDRRAKDGDDISRIEGVILDGKSINQFILDVSFADALVPDGTEIDIKIVNHTENSVQAVNSKITTLSSVDSGIDTDRERSYATVELQPLQSNKDIAANIYLTATYSLQDDDIGSIERTETICLLLRNDSDDWKDQSSSDNVRSIFSVRADRYDTLTNEWSQSSSMSAARGHLCVESVLDQVYAIGGLGANEILPAVERYSISNNSWSSMTDMPTERMGAMSVVVGTEIYVFGGIRYDKTKNIVYVSRAVERYNAVTDTWSELESMPLIDIGSIDKVGYGVAFGSATYVSSLNRIYILSGVRDITDNGSFVDYNNRVLYYDIGNDEWGYSDTISEIEFKTYSRIAPLSFVDGNSIIVLSGAFQKTDASLEYYVTGFSYNVSSGSLDAVNDRFNHMLQPRCFAASAIDGGRIYSVGGFNSDSETLKMFEAIENTGGVIPYDVLELGNTTKSKNGGGAAIVSYDGHSHVMYVGGMESGKGNGFLKISIEPYEDGMYLNGNQYLGAKVSAVDDGGNVDVLAAVKLTGYLQSLDAKDITLVPESFLPYNVLFDEDEIDVIDGESVFALKPRSDDMVNGVVDEMTFTEGLDNDLYRIVLQSTVTDGFIPETVGTVSGGLVPYYGQTLISIVNDASETEGLSPSCIVPVTSNITIASLNFKSIFSDNVFKIVSAPLYQNDSVSTDILSSKMTVPSVTDHTSDGAVVSSEALTVIDAISEEIPFGSSPLYDSLSTVSTVLNDQSFDAYDKIIYIFADNSPNVSTKTYQEAIDAINDIDNYQEVPLIVGNLSLKSPSIVSSSINRTGSAILDKLSHYTGGQSFSVVSASVEDDLVCIMTGRTKGSLGYGSAVYTIDFGEVVSLDSANVLFELPANTTGEWRMSASEDGYEYSPYTIYFEPGFDVGFSELDVRYIKLDMKITSCLTTTNEEIDDGSPTGHPLIEGFGLTYTPVKTDYLFVNEHTVDDNNRQVVSTLDSTDEGEVKFGVSTSGSHNWNDFDSGAKPSRPNAGGGVVLPVRDRDIIGIRSEALVNVDNYEFKATYGGWDYESSISILDSSNNEISASLYQLHPRDGLVIFSTKMYDSYIIRIQDPSKIRSGFRIDNSDADTEVRFHGFSEMFAPEKSIKDYLQGTTPTTTSGNVCSDFPWITCNDPSMTTASVFIDSVPGNSCYERVQGSYAYDATLDTVGFVGWWFSRIAANVVLIIIYCKTDQTYYAQIYDRSSDIAVFGADPNECTCVTLENDRFKDISDSTLCCDEISEGVLGDFTLRGVGECSFYNASVNISV